MLVGVKSDGTVVWAGNDFHNGAREIGFDQWKNIVDVDVCNCHCVALKSDGTVISEGVKHYVPTLVNLDGLNGIVKPYAGDFLKAGLKADGTIMTEDVTPYGEETITYPDGYYASQKVVSWSDISDFYSGTGYVIARKNEGSVLAFIDNKYMDEEVIYDSIVAEASQWTGLMTTVTLFQ